MSQFFGNYEHLRPAPRFFVGADVDQRVCLFVLDAKTKKPRAVAFEEWIEVLDFLGNNMGEMPIATLTRDPDEERRQS